MSILNVNKINPVGGGSTITIAGIASVTSNVSVSGSIVAGTTITGEHHGDGSNLTGINVDSTKIETGNTKVETIDTGSDGHIKVTTEGTERIRIQSDGDVGIGTINNTNNERLRVQDDASTSTSCQVSIISGSAERSILNFGDKEDPNIGRVSYHNNTNTISLFTNNTERLLINSDGYVTKPAHPCFDVVKSNGNVSSGNYITYNTLNVNNGNHYNSSNGRFTAPVAGFYFFAYGTIKNNTNSVTRLYIHKNGSRIYGHGRHLRIDDGDSYGENGAMTIVVSLAVNDYIQIKVEEGEAYGSTREYCYFNGFLIG